MAPDTELLASHQLAERLADAVAEQTEVTLSGGVVSSTAATLEEVLSHTDAALSQSETKWTRAGKAGPRGVGRVEVSRSEAP